MKPKPIKIPLDSQEAAKERAHRKPLKYGLDYLPQVAPCLGWISLGDGKRWRRGK